MNIGEKFYCSKCLKEIQEEAICPYCGYDHSSQNSPQMLEEGALLCDGRYQIGACIGAGGFGLTYAAWDLRLNQPVAIKEYFPMGLCDRDSREDYKVLPVPETEGIYQVGLLRFIREARILGTLRNVKNVVPVLDWFDGNNTAYIVMNYIRGITLDEYVRENHTAPHELISIMRDLVDTLILVHSQGILHRDISPTNIMVQEDGTLILIDFGAAANEDRRAIGKDHTVIFNKRYAPIEQYDEDGLQGPWTDVYSLSATLYTLICGEPPAEAPARVGNDPLKSPGSRGIRLKKYQEQAILQGLAVQPKKRIQSMEIFRSILYNLPLPEEVQRRKNFLKKLIAFSVTGILLCLLVMINFTVGFQTGNGLLASLQPDGWHIKGYTGSQSVLSLSEKILGINVVQIDEAAFQGTKSLVSVTIPGTVQTVREFAFNNCDHLQYVTIGSGVRNLAAQAFSDCPGLQSISVPDSIEFFTADTFRNSADRLVLLGNPRTRANDIADENKISFARIETEPNETGITILQYDTADTVVHIPDRIDGINVTIIGSSAEPSPVFPAEVSIITLPHFLERIEDYSFYEVQCTEIELPDTLNYIGNYAFSGSFLRSVRIPENVSFLGEAAFSSCVRLQSAILSSSLSEVPSGCFEGDGDLAKVTIPDGIERINTLSFGKCSGLSELNLPNSLKSIGNFAFEECTGLKFLYLPAGIKEIKPDAFDGCSNELTFVGKGDTYSEKFAADFKYEFYDINSYDPSFFQVSDKGSLFVRHEVKASRQIELPSFSEETAVRKVTDAGQLKSEDVILPEYTEIIGGKSFFGNQSLKHFTAPGSLRTIDTLAFGGCSNLYSTDLKNGLTEIGMLAFYSCSNLEKINLPDSVTSIQPSAFDGCTSLKEITIPRSLVILNNDVFSKTGLISVTIPGNVAKCRTAFYGCRNLKSAVLEEGVRSLWGTFAECSSLETVVIPSTMNEISRSTFRNCKNLKDVWIYSDDVFLDIHRPQALHMEFLTDETGNIQMESRWIEDSY